MCIRDRAERVGGMTGRKTVTSSAIAVYDMHQVYNRIFQIGRTQTCHDRTDDTCLLYTSSKTQVDTLTKNAKDFGLTHFGMMHPKNGIIHVVGPERGLTCLLYTSRCV